VGSFFISDFSFDIKSLGKVAGIAFISIAISAMGLILNKKP